MPRVKYALQKVSSKLLQPGFVDNYDEKCRLILEFNNSGKWDPVESIISANQGKIHREVKLIPGMVVEVPYATLRELSFSKHIKRIWHDATVRIMLDIAVPTTGGFKAQGMGFTGKGVTVAVIDTGIYPHPDLIKPENRIVAWNDLVNERSYPYDDNGHGTHVTGIIAGNGLSSRGAYKGMAPDVNVIGVKALDRNGQGNTSDIIAALEWCIDNQSTYNIKAVNLSIGGTAQESYRNDPLCRATSAAWNNGIAVCVAAGNDGPDLQTINSPGINPKIITVGNLDDKKTVDPSDDQISDSSSRGPTIDNISKPDILAPGTDIMSLKVRGGYRSLTGTSMASPMVTGAIAQILEKSPDLRPSQIKQMLLKNARSMELNSNEQGAGALAVDGIFDQTQQSEKPKNSFSLMDMFSSVNLQKMLPMAAAIIPALLGL